ncbi:glycosyltransferase family 39 protein [Sphingobium rhizovicinum]|uniref:Glycosyltransferase family 39 protein n=1 Tax=Sphingobium rhizovicinum TaxID=432308 RepID=A0ABV7NI51_9SPHN
MPRLRRAHIWILGLILVAALGVRLASIRFGLPGLNDPDELMFELGAVRMLRGPTLNPGWFGHPATTTMYVLALIDMAVFATGWLAGWFPTIKAFGAAIYADPSWVILPGRLAMAGFAIGTLVLTCRLGTRLFSPRAGLIAAALLAASPVHITYSQIIRSDMMACFFLLLVLLATLDMMERNRRGDLLRAALWTALAVTTKWPFALAGLAVAAGIGKLLLDRRIDARQAMARLALFGAATMAFILLLSPYLLLDYPTVLRNLSGEGQARHLGSTGGDFLYNARWYLTGPLMGGLSMAGLALLLPGALLAWRKQNARFLLGPLIAGFVLLFCSQTILWERWALPLLPLCAIPIAAAVCALADRAGPRLSLPVTAIAMAAMIAPMLIEARADARERMNDTRQVAAAWARAHIPPGSTVLIEHFAFDLIQQPWQFLFPIGDAGCVDAKQLLRGRTGYGSIDQARGSRSNLDYGTMAPGRRAQCRPDFAILTQYDRYRQEQAAFPAEYAAYRDLIGRGRIVARIAPVKGEIGGRMVTIVAFPRP